jgi:site-specific DNA recombinase
MVIDEATLRTMTKAALYARLSRDRTGEETATARQLEDCRAFATARGWEVVGEYTDADISAYKRGAVRPGYEAMLRELDQGGIDVIVAWKLDRLLRRVMDFEKLWERCEPRKANVATVRDGIDTTAPMVGVLLPRLMAIFGQLEAEQLSAREVRKHEETARNGGRAGGGHRPFGLTRDWGLLVESEAALVRDAVQRILGGTSMYSIVREWNAAGVRTPTGRQWTVQHLASMLRSPRIAGLREHRGVITAVGSWPAIVDPAAHERLRAILAGRRRQGRPARSLLAGLVRCGKCGGSMVTRRRSRTGVAMYGCEKVNGHPNCGGTYVLAEPLDDLVSNMALAALDSPAMDAAIGGAEGPDVDSQIEALRDDEEALADLTRLHFVERRIGRPEYLAARDELHERIEAARGRLAQPVATRPDVTDVRRAWANAEPEYRRQVIATVIDHVAIGPGTPGATAFDPGRVEVAWRA